MTERLNLIELEHVRAVWPLVRDRVAQLRERTAEPWLPEDVFHELMTGTSQLWISADGASFIVVSVATANYTRDLHVWLASNEALDRAVTFWPQVQAIGRDLACKRIAFESPRRWERAIPGVTARYLYTAEI